ncbi:hypothetical protein NMY22_g11795 [Coprinellus aureogranulatus]|nr:hypothetical protein NMY22_g11795 [Coprinellus aureogranulatus]
MDNRIKVILLRGIDRNIWHTIDSAVALLEIVVYTLEHPHKASGIYKRAGKMLGEIRNDTAHQWKTCKVKRGRTKYQLFTLTRSLVDLPKISTISPTTPFDKLPLELLLEIFQYLVEPSKYPAYSSPSNSVKAFVPLLHSSLSQVCQRWREAIYGCTAFRALEVYIDPPYMTEVDVRAIDSLTEFLRKGWNTTDCTGPPIILHVSLNPVDKTSGHFPPPHIVGLTRVLEPRSKMIRVLYLTNTPLTHLAALGEDSFPTLEELALLINDDTTIFVPCDFSRLRILTFNNSPLKILQMQKSLIDAILAQDKMPIRWDGLREFEEILRPDYDFKGSASQFLKTCLRKCTNLVVLSTHLCRADARSPEKAPSEYCPITMRHLKTLNLSLYGLWPPPFLTAPLIPDFEIYHAFHFPSLKCMALVSSTRENLKLDFHTDTYPPSRFTKNLERFTLGSVGIPAWLGMRAARRLFEGMPNLRTLTLYDHAWVHFLLPKSPGDSQPDTFADFLRDAESPDKVVLPKLATLNLYYTGIHKGPGATLLRLVRAVSGLLEHTRRQENQEGDRRVNLDAIGVALLDPNVQEEEADFLFQSLLPVCLAKGAGVVCGTTKKVREKFPEMSRQD